MADKKLFIDELGVDKGYFEPGEGYTIGDVKVTPFGLEIVTRKFNDTLHVETEKTTYYMNSNGHIFASITS